MVECPTAFQIVEFDTMSESIKRPIFRINLNLGTQFY